MMTTEHPLIQRAQKYQRKEINLAPDDCFYDELVGAWRDIESGELWANLPDRRGPQTKKNDIETGEDQKGE